MGARDIKNLSRNELFRKISDSLGSLAQGFLEMSNVSVVDEMVSMITAQRAYEVNSKSIQTADEMLQIANNIKR